MTSDVPQGSICGQVFNSSINDIDRGLECTILSWQMVNVEADTPEGWDELSRQV